MAYFNKDGTAKDYQSQAAEMVRSEKIAYEQSSQDIRTAIKKCRKNYACKFENPYTVAGRKKIFVPMTRWEVDTIVPKISVNDKAVTVLPRNEESLRSAPIANEVLKYQIKNTRFPTYFRNSMYDLGIDGTTVFANYWDFQRTVKPEYQNQSIKEKLKAYFKRSTEKEVPKTDKILRDKLGFFQVDILDCFTEPIANSIQDAPSFITRRAQLVENIKRVKYYKNTDKVKGYTVEQYNNYDGRAARSYEIGSTPIRYGQAMSSVYMRYGYFPMSFLTHNPKDEEYMVDGVIEVADLDEGVPVCLRVELNPFSHGKKPFEECWFQKKQGRWYGIGIAEKLIDMQEYLNRSVNRRQENEDVLHSGIFKVRRGSGISSKSLVSTPGGIVEVDKMDDIEQLQTKDISQLSDGTVRLIQNFVERIDGASEITIGSAADRSATTSIIKDRNADTRFAAVRGYVNDFLLREFSQWLELDRQFLDKKFVIRVTGEEDLYDEIDKVQGVVDPMMKQQLGKFRFLDVSPEDIRGDFDLEVDIDQSVPMNKAENAERVLKAIEIGMKLGIPRDFSKMFDYYIDNIGLSGQKFNMPTPPQMPGGMQPMGQPPQPGARPELSQFLAANQVPGPGGNGGQVPGLQTNELVAQAQAGIPQQ